MIDQRPEPVGERVQGRVAVVVLVLVWLAFVLPFFAGQVRFPVDFAGPRPGQPATELANPEHGDAYLAMYPWHNYLGERLGRGDVPLWDPHRFAGTPFAADIATGVWYPPNWLYAFGHTVHVFTLISVTSSLVALLLMYWFLRVVRIHPYAAAFGAITFAFSAFVVKWGTNETALASIIWMALPLGGIEVARRGRRWRGTVLTAVGLALVVVGGHAQLALFVWLAAFIWVGVNLAASAVRARAAGPVSWAALVRRLAGEAVPAVAAVALAAGLTAVQLLPTQQMVDGIVRQRTTWEVARGTFLPKQHAATFLLPDYLGSPVDGNYEGPGVNYTETMLYAGLLTLPLALHGLRHRHRRAVVLFAALTAVGLLAAFGTPFYRIVLATPGLSRGLFATRFLLLVDFGLAGLAALGVDRLMRPSGEPYRRPVLLAAAFAALLLSVGWLGLARPGTSLPGSYVGPLALRAAAVLLLGAVAVAVMMRYPGLAFRMALVLLVVAGADLWLTGFRFNPFQAARPVYAVQPPIGELQAVPGVRPRYIDVGTYIVPPNGAMVHGLYGLEGYDPLIPQPIVELVGIAEDQLSRAHSNFFGPFRPETAAAPVLDLLGVNHLVGRTELVDAERAVGRPMLDRPGAFPPAFASSCWELLPARRVLDRLAGMTTDDLRRTVVLDDSRAARAAAGAATGDACVESEVRINRYDPERVTMEVDARARSIVVLSDSWFPGWAATVDGKDATLLRVDHALRGVAVEPGVHRIEMRFRPKPFLYGAAISALTMAGLAVTTVAGIVRRRRGAAAPRGRP